MRRNRDKTPCEWCGKPIEMYPQGLDSGYGRKGRVHRDICRTESANKWHEIEAEKKYEELLNSLDLPPKK